MIELKGWRAFCLVLAVANVVWAVYISTRPCTPREVYVYVYDDTSHAWARARDPVPLGEMARLGYFECGPNEPEGRR